jgi:sodium/potassium-transporting ATPase subunit alpha
MSSEPAVLKQEKKEETKVDITEHLLSIEELEAKYNVKINRTKAAESPGLSHEEATKRLQEYGLNQLTPPKKKHPIMIFIQHLFNLFNLMLLVAGVAAYIIFAGDPKENFKNVLF